MGIFGRGKQRRTMLEPPERGSCGCAEHVDELLDVPVPLTTQMREEIGADAQTVGELIEYGALAVDPCVEQWLYDPGTGRDDDGPYHWTIWYGDESRASYDDDAPVELDESLRSQPGVERVVWTDREVMHVGSPTLCRDGVLAAAARALADPGVRLP